MVPNVCSAGIGATIVVGPDDDLATTSGLLNINVTRADGFVFTYSITVTD